MYWNPPIKLNKVEEKIAKRTNKAKKFFVFLRKHRDKIISKEFQDKIINTYRDDDGGGKMPVLPGQITMLLLLQAYCSVGDKEAIELTVMDKRWQMVLNCLNNDTPPFSQGTLVNFRNRLIENNLDKELLENTVSIAEKYGGFGPRQLRAVLDSSPLFGAGRVEDTFNLLGHAISKAVTVAAKELKTSEIELIREAGLELIGQSSLKAALDLDWGKTNAKSEALDKILFELDKWKSWLEEQKEISIKTPPMKDIMETIEKIIGQDTDPDPDGAGRKIKKGVSKDRIISIEDKDMRHGRKSSSKKFNGFKQHLLGAIDSKVIKEVVVRPANEAEQNVIDYLIPDLEPDLAELSIDLGYVGHPKIKEWESNGIKIVARPWRKNKNGMFTKDDFTFDFEKMQIICPDGKEKVIHLGKSVSFSPSVCNNCKLKSKCTNSKSGRAINIRDDEEIQYARKEKMKTPEGRADLRKRVVIEHRIAHQVSNQGRKVRYNGIRKNQYDGRRHASVINLQLAQQYYEQKEVA